MVHEKIYNLRTVSYRRSYICRDYKTLRKNKWINKNMDMNKIRINKD